MAKDFSVLVLISGRGSNLQSLIQSCQIAKITHVISNKPSAPGLDYAQQAGIPATSFDRKKFDSVHDQKQALFEHVASLKPDLVALAGFMLIIPPAVVEEWSGKLINIHPSLLPQFPGLDTHRRALEAGVDTHGCSVHYVDTGLDTGPRIAQAPCECLVGDTEEVLAARVLEREHQLYPWVVDAIAGGRIECDDSGVSIDEDLVGDAKEKGFVIPNSVRRKELR